jgi:cellulose synthase/poly-beta-1,6-N-acetylglucosamine synthase-like glycosyltransferase
MRDIFLVSYFFLLTYVAIYGVHIYWLIFLYLKSRNKTHDVGLPEAFRPVVTVQLPVYNERKVAARSISAVAGFHWPSEKLQIQVLDDSDDSTTEIIAHEVARLRESGSDIEHIRRQSRKGFKAGALANGLRFARGELVAIFDADNVPERTFLMETVGHFTDPSVGMVQARWGFLNRESSFLCRAQALFLDAHFLVEQVARSRSGLLMNFNGTAGVWRKQAIVESGGWSDDTLTEDLDLSYRVQLRGWQARFVDDVVVPTELPSSLRSFKSQQRRWSKGAIETAIKVLPQILRSDLPLRVKLGSFLHLTQKTVSVALLILSILLVPALYFRLQGGALKLFLIDLPVFVAGTGSMSLFYGLAYRHQREARSFRNSAVLPVLTSIGIALTANNSLAVLSALFGRKDPFVRTPKTGATGREIIEVPRDYRTKANWSVGIEVVLALYSALAVFCASYLGLIYALPYLLTFAFGFLYFSVISVKESYA